MRTKMYIQIIAIVILILGTGIFLMFNSSKILSFVKHKSSPTEHTDVLGDQNKIPDMILPEQEAYANTAVAVGSQEGRTPIESLELPNINNNPMSSVKVPNGESSQVQQKMSDLDKYNGMKKNIPDPQAIREQASTGDLNNINVAALISSLPEQTDYKPKEQSEVESSTPSTEGSPSDAANLGVDPVDPNSISVENTNAIAKGDEGFIPSTADKLVTAEMDGNTFIYNTDKGLESPIQGYITATYKTAVYRRVSGSLTDSIQFVKLKVTGDTEVGFDFASPVTSLTKEFTEQEEWALMEYTRALLEKHFKSVNPGVQIRVAVDANEFQKSFTDAWDKWYKHDGNSLNTRLLYELKIGDKKAYAPYEIKLEMFADKTLGIDPSFKGSGMVSIDDKTFRVDTTFPLLNKIVTGDNYTEVKNPSAWYNPVITNWDEFIGFNKSEFIQNIITAPYLPTLKVNSSIMELVK